MTELLRKRWYVVQAQSGFEARAKKGLEELINVQALQHLFGDILIPTESVIELKAGKKHQSKKKFFPGYLLVQMIINEESWYLVRSVPNVIGFVGGTAAKPIPMSDQEADIILNRLQESEERPRHRFAFEPGEEVRVCEGPFADFKGTVEKVDYAKNRLQVLVSIFGRATPIELKFNHVKKD